MKKFIVILSIIFIGIFIFIGFLNMPVKQQYIRIHIRANSNQQIDQDIKYCIKDKVVLYLTPFVANCTDKQSFIDVITQNLDNIEDIADAVLKQNGFNYSSKAHLNKEKFPARSYNGFVLESGIYDALVLELGTGKGDNWWCVVYPPLCFVSNDNQNILYKSKILEILNSIINGK